MSSRARNLAGFVTAISPQVDLQVGVVTATRFDGPFDVTIGFAQTAGIATFAQTAGIATYAEVAGIATVSEGLTGSPDITVGDVNVTGVITATSFSGPTTIGIQSGGTAIGTATTLNFVGSGNTFAVNGTTIDVSIAGGNALGERLSDDSTKPDYKIYKQRKLLLVDQDVDITNTEVDSDFDGVAYIAEADIQVSVGNTMTIGAGVTFRTNILGIFPA